MTALAQEKDYPDILRRLVNETFQKKSQGSFLWIGMAAKDLEAIGELVEVRHYLENAPRSTTPGCSLEYLEKRYLTASAYYTGSP